MPKSTNNGEKNLKSHLIYSQNLTCGVLPSAGNICESQLIKRTAHLPPTWNVNDAQIKRYFLILVYCKTNNHHSQWGCTGPFSFQSPCCWCVPPPPTIDVQLKGCSVFQGCRLAAQGLHFHKNKSKHSPFRLTDLTATQNAWKGMFSFHTSLQGYCGAHSIRRRLIS